MSGTVIGPVLVLGAGGYLGSTLVTHLARRGTEVVAVGRRAPRAVGPTVRTAAVDATDPDDLARVVAGAGAVVHLVAHLVPGRSWRVADDDPAGEAGTVGPARALVAALRDRRVPVVTASTVGIAGCPERIRLDGTEPDDPRTPYDRQKLAAERALLESGLPAVPVRLPTVYGRGADPAAPGTGVVAAMAQRAAAGRDLTLWHDGSVRRDLLHVRDVAAALDAAVRHADRLAGRPWVIGTGIGVPLGAVVRGLATRIADRTGREPVPVVQVPAPDHAAPTDFHSVEVDPAAFRAVTGWRARTPLGTGLDEVADAVATRPVPV
ncbi:NAD-dependent epimerase/dehydratase family protein [Actinomycetospora termitidis]|uniref:NAD-dependent epimerase/dehydratase family protein n=1 Tax=Actinomycetospora termitidis TaxID=3053470 RepID=A0ABT7MGW9_9PSEU|nr:NAD-dependent epimerase/dehydratase family protein [Actinomycetospora sp. Odt1-22]MDL5158593.1 NAD-dependent epimerase/dehydratase family protein [Actinomycetospora sp. Odt1-22]